MYVAAALCITVLLGTLAPPSAAAPATVDIQLLNISDWHAQLDPILAPGLGNVGGAAAISSYWKADRASNPNTLTLTGGDAFGASPPLSGFFDDIPAVQAMNLMGIDADTLGNHNFDNGLPYLQEKIDAADFDYVSANLKNLDGNLTDVAPFQIFDVGGVKVAVVGITNSDAPELVAHHNMGALQVTDPVSAANKARAEAKRAGAQVFVAVAHLGVTRVDPNTGSASGPLIDFAESVGGYDVIFGDHTDFKYSGVIGNTLVVENRSKGLTYAKVNLSVDPISGRIAGRTIEFVTPVTSAVSPDPQIVELLAPYRQQLAARMDEPIGVATDVFPRGGNIERLREVALGNLVADAMRQTYGTQIAFTNGGGLRDALPSSYLPQDKSLRRRSSGYAAGPPYDLVVGDIFSVLPFGNEIVTRSITGADLYAALEHSVAALPSANGRFLQISGFRFKYSSALPPGSRIVEVVLDDGTPILRDATLYTVALNDFVNEGGDGYSMLSAGDHGVTRALMADAVLDFVRAAGTVIPVVDGRIADVAS
jgi:5'-nucleotidase